MPEFKLLIADDEALARFAFRTLIEKNFPDIEVAGEAENGNEAVDMAKSLKPDIIAMDIKMPGLNGIEASEEILKVCPETGILILTAYDNFDYVQKALDIGVKGYLLKPFKKDEVVEKLNKMVCNMSDGSRNADFKEQVESKIRIVKPFIQRELISAIIGGNADMDEVLSYSTFLQENIDSGYFMVISFGSSFAESINDSVRNRIYREKVYDVLEKHLPLMKKCIVGNALGNSIAVFFPFDSRNLGSEGKSESVMIAQEISKRIDLIARIKTAIGIGTPQSGVSALKTSYNQACAALRNSDPERLIVHFDECSADSGKDSRRYPLNLENDLMQELRSGNIERARTLAGEMTACFSEVLGDSELLKEFINQLITMLKRTALQLGAGVDSLAALGRLSETAHIEDPEGLIVWCRNSMSNIIDILGSLKHKDKSKVKRVLEFINRNFLRDITLEMAAEEAGLTPQYLSRVFKEETGFNFVEYVTEKRINYAKEMMKGTTKNMRDVSIAAGYPDVNYFCRLFKKTTGLTPKQYKNSL